MKFEEEIKQFNKSQEEHLFNSIAFPIENELEKSRTKEGINIKNYDKRS
jgi:hypothetical protein